jgi:hypothetical protein
MKRAVISLCVVGAATAAIAQPRGGVLRVRLVNGTTGEPGRAEKATLFRLRNEMEPAKEVENVSGNFEIADIEVEGEMPMLLQVTSSGVSYNEPVRFGRGYEAEAEITVYDVLPEWNDDLEVETARFVYRRDGDKLLVDKIYVIQNRTSPKKTYYDPEGSFRFVLPTSGLLELHSITARGESGMPVPQQASEDANGRGYVTKTAFKPGETELAVSYEVDYSDAGYRMGEMAFLPVRELYAFVAPADVTVDAEGWEPLGNDPEGRFVAFRKLNVELGDRVELGLSGGSERAIAIGSGGSSSGVQSAAPSGTVTRIPDTTLSGKWLLVLLMAAALAYGLLVTLYPPSARRG